MDGVMPRVGVFSSGAVPAAVVRFEGSMVPAHASVLASDGDAFAFGLEFIPDFGGAKLNDIGAWAFFLWSGIVK